MKPSKKAPKTKAPGKAKAGAATLTISKGRRPTVSSVARELILAGRTDEQVLAELHKRFGLDVAAKKRYPGWYRAQLVRNGKLTKARADATRH